MSALEDLQARLDAYTFTSGLVFYSPRLEVRPGQVVRYGRQVQVDLILKVPCAYEGIGREVARDFHIYPSVLDEALDRMVFKAFASRLVHELGEGILRDGSRVFDPHARPPRWPWVGVQWPW